MGTQWTKINRGKLKVENDFHLLDEQEVIDTISKNVGVPPDAARAALPSLAPYENSPYFRSDELDRWILENANRLRFAHLARGV